MKIYKYLGIAIISAIIYFTFAVLLLNGTIVNQTIQSTATLFYKSTLFFYIVTGVQSTLSSLDMALLFITTVLVGINMALSFAVVDRFKSLGKISVTTAGGTMLGIVSSGCASCGFSALSLFGLSGVIALLPFRGEELYILAIVLLSLSLYYNIHQLQKPLVCKSK